MKKFVKPLICLLLLTAAACSPQSQEQTAPHPTTHTPQNQNSPIYVNGEIIGEINRTASSVAEIEKARERRRATGLQPISVDPIHNASVYKITGLADEDQFMVAPRLFVYGTNVKNLLRGPDGNVQIPFNIAIIDGLSTHIHAPDVSGQALEVPELLRVKNYADLKNELLQHGSPYKKFSVGAIPGCPSRISISAAGSTYDVTPDYIKESDYCELNKPFTVQLKVPEVTARNIMGSSLRSNNVDIFVNYAVMVPVPVSQMSVKFNRTKLFEAIQARMTGQYPPYGRAELNANIQSVFESSKMNIYIQGEYTEQMSRLVDQAVAEFFVPFRPDPKLPAPSKCDSFGCFDVSFASLNDSSDFEVKWTHSENMRIEKVIRIGSKLKPVNDVEVPFGRDQKLGTSTAAVFTNKNPNPETNPLNVYSAGLTPQRGAVLELIPTSYSMERRHRNEETKLDARSWRECTGRVGWENKCSYTNRTEELYSHEFTGDDKWITTINPLGSIPRLLNGLKVYFRFSNGESFTCNLEDLEGESNNSVRTILIENSPACPLFDESRKVITDFGLINNTLLDSVTFIQGNKLVTNYGKDWSTYKEVTYSPEVQISGRLKMIGLGFMSIHEIK
ncbi:hypothetical protein [Bdellovibrio sp. HCB288]|uniref:hypothetical protein n=1 Tax=Bdellovibrio sp. HCB288 TaxID=3394355 RepID=UPI0039B3EBCC